MEILRPSFTNASAQLLSHHKWLFATTILCVQSSHYRQIIKGINTAGLLHKRNSIIKEHTDPCLKNVVINVQILSTLHITLIKAWFSNLVFTCVLKLHLGYEVHCNKDLQINLNQLRSPMCAKLSCTYAFSSLSKKAAAVYARNKQKCKIPTQYSCF